METNMSIPSTHITRHFTLQASAGAGKTRVLIQEIFDLYLDAHKKGNALPKVIATTFTKKATQEMKERLMQKAIENKEWELLSSFCDSNQIIISTLHGILLSFLRKQSHPLVLGAEIMNSRQELSLTRSIVRDLLSQNKNFYNLLEHFSFSDLCENITKMQSSFRSPSKISTSSEKEEKQQWTDYIQNLFNKNKNDIPYEDPRIQKILTAPLEIDEAQIKDLKNLKNKTCKSIAKDLEKKLKSSHFNQTKQLRGSFQLMQNLFQIFSEKWDLSKKERKWFQINDIEKLTLKLIEQDASALSYISKEWGYWFIDEYQDISPTQEKILQILFKNARKTWAVGDPQQSIYAFRNASPKVFQRRYQLSREQKSFEEKLINYRSQPELIHFFNDLFDKDCFKKFSIPPNFTNKKENKITFSSYDKTQSDFKKNIALRLNQLIKEGVKPSQICILTQRNAKVSDIGAFLRHHKFPIQIHSKKSFRRELIDILYLVKFLEQPYHNQTLIGLLRTPYFYLSDLEISKLSKSKKFLWDQMNEHLPDAKPTHILRLLLEKSKEIGYSETISYFLEEFLMIDLSYFLDNTESQEAELWNFLIELKSREKHSRFNYVEFIEDQLNEIQEPSVEGGSKTQFLNPNFIQIMTVHQSKGLEFDYVIIPQIDADLTKSQPQSFICNPKENKFNYSIKNTEEESVKPLEMTLWEEELKESQLSESDRLFYVAVTRAKKNITFICEKKNSDKLIKNSHSVEDIKKGFENSKSHFLEWARKECPYKEDTLQKNNWLHRFSFFYYLNLYLEISAENTNLLTRFSLNYELEIIHTEEIEEAQIDYKESQSKQIEQLKPLNPIEKQEYISKPNFFSTIQMIKGSIEGSKLHDLLYRLTLSGQPVDMLLSTLQGEEKEKYKKAIEYLKNLETPPMELLLKQKLAEWSFMYKKEDQIHAGRIDLWGHDGDILWIVDYKSSKTEKLKNEVWDQLESYGQALKLQFSDKKIKLCAIQPFIKKYEIRDLN